LNIPLDEIGEAVTWLIKDIPIVTCCETGSRSEAAKNILEANGFEKVYNGGSYNNLDGIKFSAGCSVKH
jgi:rhodanese-related sulfurtransferase